MQLLLYSILLLFFIGPVSTLSCYYGVFDDPNQSPNDLNIMVQTCSTNAPFCLQLVAQSNTTFLGIPFPRRALYGCSDFYGANLCLQNGCEQESEVLKKCCCDADKCFGTNDSFALLIHNAIVLALLWLL